MFLLSFLMVLAISSSAQQSDKTSSQTTEAMREDEHLPFMKSETINRSEDSSTGGMIIQTIGAMLLIVGLIFGGAWGLKKFGFGSLKTDSAEDIPNVTILSTVSLGTNRSLSVVRFGERMLLVGTTPQNFTLLADETVSEKIAPTFSSPTPRSVAELLEEENTLFEMEFRKAQTRLTQAGGEI